MRSALWGAVAVVTALWSSAAGLTIITPVAPDDPVVVSGLSDLGAMSHDIAPSVFSVYVAHPGDVPPVMGSYSFDGNAITFMPRFPFQPGQEYRVVVDYGSNASETTFLIPAAAVPSETVVDVIYPTAAIVPENLLRFYVQFSEPMRGRDAYTSVTLFDASGAVVEDAFVETTPELWDESMQRLTLICHPGRVKRGLALNRREGPPLRNGQTFTLRVDGMLNAAGQPLAERYEKTFAVGPADRVSPDPDEWVVRAPRANTTEAVQVDFGESLNQVLFDRLIAVVDTAGTVLDGWITSDVEGTVWVFRPTTSWSPGRYDIAVHVAMEDLAGNRLDMLFDAADQAALESPQSNGDSLRKIRFIVE